MIFSKVSENTQKISGWCQYLQLRNQYDNEDLLLFFEWFALHTVIVIPSASGELKRGTATLREEVHLKSGINLQVH